MRPIFLVMSCAKHQGAHQAMARSTWLKLLPIEYRFFLGRKCEPVLPDEVVVDAHDGYWGLLEKQRNAYKWAVQNEYTHAFVACIDTYVATPRLLASGLLAHDYVGRAHTDGHTYAGGGAGYWLSHKALQLLADAPITARSPYTGWPDYVDGADLAKANIVLYPDNRFWSTAYESPPFANWDDKIISVHLSRATGNYDPLWMYECHNKYLEFTKCNAT